MEDNYIEINLLDLCKEFLRKWKIFVLLIVVCSLFSGLYGLYQLKKAKPDDATIVKSLVAGMTQEEKDSVEDSAKVINGYRSVYKKQKEYNEKSIYQNLNPYNVDTLTISYYVDNHYQVSYPVIEQTNNLVPIAKAYTSGISEESFYADLAKEFGITDTAYVKELITVDSTCIDSGVFSISIYANNDEMLEKMGKHIKETIEAKNEDLSNIYGQHDVVLTAEVYEHVVDTKMVDVQKTNLERLTILSNNIANEEKLYSGNQLAYLHHLVHEEMEEIVSIKKLVVIGAIIGFVAATVYVFIRYLLDDTIKTESEFKQLLGVPIIGKNDDKELLACRINNFIKVDALHKIAIIDNAKTDGLDSLVAMSEPDTVRITNDEPESQKFEKMISCDAAIVIGEVRKSKRKELLKIREICQDTNVKLIGVVLK